MSIHLTERTISEVIADLEASRPGHAVLLCAVMAMIAGRHVSDEEAGNLGASLANAGLKRLREE